MPESIAVTLDALDASGRGVRVTFHRRGDRFVHSIEVVAPGQSAIVATSSEGDAEQDWPPSPPLQQISQLPSRDGRQSVLLIGMAGRNHWSISVEADPVDRAITFDVACRCTSQPTSLGSAYTFPGCEAGPAGIRFDVEIVPDGPPAKIERTGDGMAVAVDHAAASLPCTLRWKYCVVAAIPSHTAAAVDERL